MTKKEFAENKEEKQEALKALAFDLTYNSKNGYCEPTLNLFGCALRAFIEYDDISETYIRNCLCFLLSHDIIYFSQYSKIDTLIRQAVELHETTYSD